MKRDLQLHHKASKPRSNFSLQERQIPAPSHYCISSTGSNSSSPNKISLSPPNFNRMESKIQTGLSIKIGGKISGNNPIIQTLRLPQISTKVAVLQLIYPQLSLQMGPTIAKCKPQLSPRESFFPNSVPQPAKDSLTSCKLTISVTTTRAQQPLMNLLELP